MPVERVARLRAAPDHAAGHAARQACSAWPSPSCGVACEWVVDVMGEAYPEIVAERARIEAVVRGEEERFAETLDNGMRRIEEYAAAQGEGQGRTIDGRFLFTLYDTFGFPRDLAEDELRDRGWMATEATDAAWEQEMSAQRERARASAAFGTDAGTEAAAVYQRLSAELPSVEFVGYETLSAPARILAMVAAGDGPRRVREAAEGVEVEVILDRTPAYAESGGQIGDTGTIVGRSGRGEIVDTYHRGAKLIVHRVHVTVGRVPRRRGRGRHRRVATTAGAAPAPHGHAPAPRRPAQGSRHSRRPGRLAGRARPPALRLLPRRRGEGP